MRPRGLDLLVLHVSSRCDQTCGHCSIWKGNARVRTELGPEARLGLIREAHALGARAVLFTGGEPLLCDHLETLARTASGLGLVVQIASNGLGLGGARKWVGEVVDEVYVSFEGRAPVYDALRGGGMSRRLAASLHAVTAGARRPRLVARAVISSRNAGTLDETAAAARELGFDGISFLPLDTTSEAFGGDAAARSNLALSAAEVAALHGSIDRLAAEGQLGVFVAEDERKMREIAAFLAADPWSRRGPLCNAPEWSSVVEADGSLRPCFFQPVFGNVGGGSLREARSGASYRDALLDLGRENRRCASCVCPKYIPSAPRAMLGKVKAVLSRVRIAGAPAAGSQA